MRYRRLFRLTFDAADLSPNRRSAHRPAGLTIANGQLLADVAVIRGFAPSMLSLASADPIYLVKANVQQPTTCPVQFAETHRHASHSFMGDDG